MPVKNNFLLNSLVYICNMQYIYIFFIVIFFSCCKKEISSKSNVLSEKMFINIIKDIHLNEAKFDNLKRINFVGINIAIINLVGLIVNREPCSIRKYIKN